MVAPKHPAKYSKQLMPVFADLLKGRKRVLDPMAGTGKIHGLPNWTVGIEIEPEWAEMDPRTVVGDAHVLPFPSSSFDAVCVSPTYGNRFADHHKAKDASRRRSYTHDLGRDLHPNNSGTLHWGPKYRDFHVLAWDEVARVLERDGIFVLNVKDHVRKKEVQPVCQWHRDFLIDGLGFQLVNAIPISVTGLRYGENHEARVDHEWVFSFKKGY